MSQKYLKNVEQFLKKEFKEEFHEITGNTSFYTII